MSLGAMFQQSHIHDIQELWVAAVSVLATRVWKAPDPCERSRDESMDQDDRWQQILARRYSDHPICANWPGTPCLLVYMTGHLEVSSHATQVVRLTCRPAAGRHLITTRDPRQQAQSCSAWVCRHCRPQHLARSLVFTYCCCALLCAFPLAPDPAVTVNTPAATATAPPPAVVAEAQPSSSATPIGRPAANTEPAPGGAIVADHHLPRGGLGGPGGCRRCHPGDGSRSGVPGLAPLLQHSLAHPADERSGVSGMVSPA